MTKFYGPLGYIQTIESPAGSGIWVEEPVEYNCYGDVIYDHAMKSENDQLNGEVRINARISVVDDGYITRNAQKLRYVKWMGSYWTVSSVEIRPPRLILNLGKVYNGRTVETTKNP